MKSGNVNATSLLDLSVVSEALVPMHGLHLQTHKIKRKCLHVMDKKQCSGKKAIGRPPTPRGTCLCVVLKARVLGG